MKYLILIIFVQLIIRTASGCSMQSGFAEMYYAIDSTNPYLVHVTLITTDTYYCLNDSVRLSYLTRHGVSHNGDLHIIDTANVEDGYVLKTYQGTVLIDTLASDSIFILFYESPVRHIDVINFSLGQTPLQISLSINYAGISNAGIASPEINGPRIGYGSVGDTLVYDPLVSYVPSDSIFVSLQNETGGYELPYLYAKHAYPSDTGYVNDTSGIITWLYPRFGGYYYDILYQVNQYRNGNYIGYIQRDMLLYIWPDTSSAGINNINGQQKNIQIYPNPTNDFLYISIPDDSNDPKRIEIVNALGQIIKMANVTEDFIKMDCSGLPIGVYTISVKTDANIYCSKFVMN
jgi:hypothetical protein